MFSTFITRQTVRALRSPSCGLATLLFSLADTGERIGLITAEDAARPDTQRERETDKIIRQTDIEASVRYRQ